MLEKTGKELHSLTAFLNNVVEAPTGMTTIVGIALRAAATHLHQESKNAFIATNPTG
jgi:hypothetical protein